MMLCNTSHDLTSAIVPAGTLLPAWLRELGVQSGCLFGNLLGYPVEVGAIDPHPVQDHSELPSRSYA
jgi:hypothetical protein